MTQGSGEKIYSFLQIQRLSRKSRCGLSAGYQKPWAVACPCLSCCVPWANDRASLAFMPLSSMTVQISSLPP